MKLQLECALLRSRCQDLFRFDLFFSPDEEYVSLIEFESLDELEAWRDHPEHREAQEAGRERFYSEYSVQVCQPIRESFFTFSDSSANKKL